MVKGQPIFDDDFFIGCAVAKLTEMCNENAGRAPKGAIDMAMASLQQMKIPVSRHAVVRRMRANTTVVPISVRVGGQRGDSSVISDITNPIFSEPTEVSRERPSHTPNNFIFDSKRCKELKIAFPEYAEGIRERPPDDPKVIDVDPRMMKKLVVDEITLAFVNLKEECFPRRVPKNALAELIEDKKREYELDENVYISQKTIRNRLGSDRKTLFPGLAEFIRKHIVPL